MRIPPRLLPIAIVAAFCACGDRSSVSLDMASASMPKAACGPGDTVETGFQGQVPAAVRHLGAFGGFHCNLALIGQLRGEGAGWQSLFFRDRQGRLCAYYDTSPRTAGRQHTGVAVVDATSPTEPVVTARLTTPAMLDPAETLAVNERRQVIAAVRTAAKDNIADVDVYDLSADCRFPRLLSAATPNSPSGGPATRANGGNFSPDGLTYYATNLRDGLVDVIDMKNPTNPRVLAEWSMPFNQRTSGLAIASDGRRAYLTLYGQGAAMPGSHDGARMTNGLIVVDVSEVQARHPAPQPRVVSSLVWGDGSASHQLLPVKIQGGAYLIATDEGGSGYPNASGWQASCQSGLPPWPMARIVDIGDEQHPKIVARLQLEMNDPRHCDQVLPDLAGRSGFTYGSHYCSVDDPENATALACAYFESGIRVFDIRDPTRPREIAYFVPPSVTSPSPASFNNATAADGRPDHCSAELLFDKASGTLMTTCQDNGFLVLQFTNGVWPLTTGATRTEAGARASNAVRR